MAAGLEGFEIGKGSLVIVNPTFGLKGFEMTKISREYIAPQFGLIGFEFNVVDSLIGNRSKKTVKF